MSPKRIAAWAGVLTIVLLGIAGPLAGQQTITAKKDIFIAAGETQDNVFTFGGNVVVEGRVKESVIAFGGTIVVSGEVGQAVVGIGSHVTLKPTAVVRGDVVSLGGVLDKEPGCTINGDTVYFKASEIGSRLFKDRFMKGIFAYPLFPLFLVLKLIGVFLWLIAALAVAAIFPKQIARASAEIHKAFWPSFGTGLLAILIYVGLVIVATVLCFILIGIPIAIALATAGFIVKVFGRVVLFYFLGESLLKSMKSKDPSMIGAVLTGLVVVSFISFIPFIGALFGLILSIIGWGVTLRTRFGTADNWFRKK
jgi:hypothetical protein